MPMNLEQQSFVATKRSASRCELSKFDEAFHKKAAACM